MAKPFEIHNGSVVSKKDEHGNDRHEAKSSLTGEKVLFWSFSAATHWLWIIDATVKGRQNRLGSKA